MNHEYLTLSYIRPTLKHCIKCEGTGKSLPTECPGKPMTDTQEIRVVGGESDFVNGKWRNVL